MQRSGTAAGRHSARKRDAARTREVSAPELARRENALMGAEFWVPVLGLRATILLVVVGLLNFSVFRRQLQLAREQIDTAVRQLELARKQPDLYLIQRAIAQTSDHVRLIVDK